MFYFTLDICRHFLLLLLKYLNVSATLFCTIVAIVAYIFHSTKPFLIFYFESQFVNLTTYKFFLDDVPFGSVCAHLDPQTMSRT